MSTSAVSTPKSSQTPLPVWPTAPMLCASSKYVYTYKAKKNAKSTMKQSKMENKNCIIKSLFKIPLDERVLNEGKPPILWPSFSPSELDL